MNKLASLLLVIAGFIAVLHGMIPHNHADEKHSEGFSALSSADDAVDFFMLNAGADHLENLLPRLSGPDLPSALILFPISFALIFLSLSFFLSGVARQRFRGLLPAPLFAGVIPRVILRPPPVL